MQAARFAWRLLAILMSYRDVSAVEGVADYRRSVSFVAAERVATAGGTLPLAISPPGGMADPVFHTAVIMLHGRRRDADTYLAAAEAARRIAGEAAAGCLLAVPQFLAPVDVAHHRLPGDTLRWSFDGWMAGEPALEPAPISSYAAIDALLSDLAQSMPGLRRIVIAGHSAGGQVAQRYGLLGRMPDSLARCGVALRLVVANPSSYVYFSGERPVATEGCPGYDHWKYGMQRLPDYAGDRTPAELEAAYLRRHITYLLGGDDTETTQPSLDRTCAAQAQGANRLQRGLHYAQHLGRRAPNCTVRLTVVPGVGHDAAAMFGSAAGLDALFGRS